MPVLRARPKLGIDCAVFFALNNAARATTFLGTPMLATQTRDTLIYS